MGTRFFGSEPEPRSAKTGNFGPRLSPNPRKVKNLGPILTRTRSSSDPSSAGSRPGPTRPRPGVFFTNIQQSICTWTYRDDGLTTYNWLPEEKNRDTIISFCLFLSINASKIKSFRLVEKRRTKVLYVDFSFTLFRFQAKIKLGLFKNKDAPGSEKKIIGPKPRPEKKICRSGPGFEHARSSLINCGGQIC